MGTRECKRREDVDKIKMPCDRKNDKIRIDERENGIKEIEVKRAGD